jgi:hypothetical protein
VQGVGCRESVPLHVCACVEGAKRACESAAALSFLLRSLSLLLLSLSLLLLSPLQSPMSYTLHCGPVALIPARMRARIHACMHA